MKSAALSILVVDDERPIAASIASLLSRRGHRVSIAASAEEALESPTPEVLVADVALRGLSGLDLLAAFKARGGAPRTIFLSSRPTVDLCRSALLLGGSEFLTKPFRLDDLVRAIEAAPSAVVPNEPRAPFSSGASAASNERGPAWIFERTYDSTPLCVERAARDMTAFALRCGIGPAARARVASATSELVDNARRHGYVNGPGAIFVRAESDGREISVSVRDEGRGFEPASLANGSLEDGLARAMSLSEDFEMHSAPGEGTCVTLHFTVFRVDFDDDASIDLTELDFLTPDLSRRVLHALRKPDTKDLFQLSPALAVVVGRLLAGPDQRRSVETALWS
jgi:CheY-like chemotaxis protein